MTNFLSIRKRLNLTQSALAVELGVSQANISLYEHGQDVPPAVARKLILVGQGKSLDISFDDIYSALSDNESQAA